MKPIHFTLVALLLVTLGCGTTKSIEGSVIADKNLSVKALLNAHKAASQDFNTLAARMQVKYEAPKESQSITTSLRIKKGKHLTCHYL
jgi:outer membrane lipoprotein-sorting protein